MRKRFLLISLIVVLVVPEIIFSVVDRWIMPAEEKSKDAEPSVEYSQNVCVLQEDEAVTMELDEYVVGVLLGEMPAEFHMEALKAQAVAIRTYTLRHIHENTKHEEASVCTDSTCCQAYVTAEDYSGSKSEIDRIQQAVAETEGLVLTYASELIEATYFSSSGGRTESAVEVWGAEIPYLQALDSPGEENAVHFRDTTLLSVEDFLEKLGLPKDTASSITISDLSYTEGGGVDTVTICGKKYKGTQLRDLLSLRSTAFTLQVVGDAVLITSKGHGHRVGMSQYGAQAMALAGKHFEEILMYYYPGTALELWKGKESS